jgi:hypothetical protein
MRKNNDDAVKPVDSKVDNAIDDALILGVGLVLIGLFGVLAITYAWEAVVLTAPL